MSEFGGATDTEPAGKKGMAASVLSEQSSELDDMNRSSIELKRALDQAMEILKKHCLDGKPLYSSILIDINNGVFKRTISISRDKSFNEVIKFSPIFKIKPSSVQDILNDLNIIHELANGASSISLAAWLIVGKGITRREDLWAWEGTMTPAQIIDVEDIERMNFLIQALFDKFYPLWSLVAEGNIDEVVGVSQEPKWTTAQSTDALRFFSAWLILDAPFRCLELFCKSKKLPELCDEISSNLNIYCYCYDEGSENEMYFLHGIHPSPEKHLGAFRARYTIGIPEVVHAFPY